MNGVRRRRRGLIDRTPCHYSRCFGECNWELKRLNICIFCIQWIDSERRIRILELNSTRMYESLMRAFLSIERVDHPAHPPRYLALQTAFGTIINGISIINLSILHMAHLVCHFPFEFYGSGQDIAHRNPARPSSTCSIIA